MMSVDGTAQNVRARPYRRARDIDVIVVGAGHAGLAVSWQLSDRGIEHVVLDAGDVGQRWRHERWDSLSLLTPNWTIDLPGKRYRRDDADEFMHKDALADYLSEYAVDISAPVKRYSRVHRIAVRGPRYEVTTTQGIWRCRSVVLATGAFADPIVPQLAQYLPAQMQQLNSKSYKNPSEVHGQRVLVVGGSSTGLQFAQELAGAGKEVILSVGEHVRMPRTIAGKDIYFWLDRSGVFTETTQEVDDLSRARKVPSPQLIGADVELNLNTIAASGIEIVGRLVGMNGQCDSAQGEDKMNREAAHQAAIIPWIRVPLGNHLLAAVDARTSFQRQVQSRRGWRASTIISSVDPSMANPMRSTI